MPTRRGDAAKPQARSALLAAARAGSPRGTERLAERLQLQGCCKPPVATSPPSPSVLPCFLPCQGQRPQQPGCLSSRQHASRPPACKLCVPPEEPPLAPAPPQIPPRVGTGPHAGLSAARRRALPARVPSPQQVSPSLLTKSLEEKQMELLAIPCKSIHPSFAAHNSPNSWVFSSSYIFFPSPPLQ